MGKNDTPASEAKNAYLIALGSNIGLAQGGPQSVVEGGVSALEGRGFVIRKVSRFFRSAAFPAGSGPDFVNAAALIETSLGAADTLAELHAVEAQMGRTRERRWGARTLDLDLIAAGDLVLPDAQTHLYWREMPLELQKTATPQELILPHPRLAERAFVLVPLMDVAPEWRHPLTGKSIREMHDALPQALCAEVVAL